MNQLDIAKAALADIGARSKIASLVDESAEAQYINLLYAPLRDFMLAEGDYDFSLVGAALAASGGQLVPWTQAYTYPADALRIRQLVPTSYVALDPKPVEWTVNSQGGTKRIFTRQACSTAIYTKAVDEALWEPMFTEAFIRMLGSVLAFALENKLELSKEKLQEALSFAGIAGLRDE